MSVEVKRECKWPLALGRCIGANVRQVGALYYCKKHAREVEKLREYLKSGAPYVTFLQRRFEGPIELLNPREFCYAEMFMQGYERKEVAAHFQVSLSAVDHAMARARRKLRCKNVFKLASYGGTIARNAAHASLDARER